MRPLERFFHWYGRLVARRPWPFIVVPTILTIIASYGMLFFHSQDDIWDIYAPTNGLSRVEEAHLKQFEYASGSHHHRVQILVSRKDGGNLLQTELLEEIAETHRYIADNVTLSNGEQEFTYNEVCGAYCNDSNSAVLAFLQAVVESDGSSSSLQLTFPNAKALQNRVFMGYSLGDLSFKPTRHEEQVNQARLFILHYMVDTTIKNGKEMALNFEMELRRIFESLAQSSTDLNYALLSRTRELEEQRKITLIAIPFLFLTVLVLSFFMLLTLFDYPLYRSQHVESLLGVLSPGMALWTAGGLLFWLGFPFSNILTVVPFLVVTIGIDDAFLILAGWRHAKKDCSLEARMGEAISISGASVSVTSITDVLCFAIGLFSNMPVVQLFCLYTTVALFIDFVYQMTFFTAWVGILGRRKIRLDEERKLGGERQETSSFEKLKAKLKESTSSFSLSFPNRSVDEKEKTAVEEFVGWLHTRCAQLLVLAIFMAHIVVASYFAAQVNTDFDMENLYLEDSPLTDISRRMQDFVLREAFVVNFAVQPMPDFSNETVRDEFEEMVQRLETIPNFGAGPESTNLWLREFSNAIAFWGDDEDFWLDTELLRNYREYGMEEKYINTRSTEEGPVIDGFFFSITYHNMSSFLEVEELMTIRRSILSEYEQFHVFSHHPLEKVPTESAASAPSNFLQTVVSAIVLMSILVLIFVMNVEAIISVVVSIMSICVGVVAYLHLWNVHLDGVSLISILMSIGFSVDYSAHVCYHYFAHAAEEEKDQATDSIESQQGSQSSVESSSTHLRLVSTIRGVGWPVIQSGLSTIVGIFPLMFVHAYVVAVFWKTIVLVGILGMFHALLLLPVIFILTHDLKTAVTRCLRKNN